MTPTETSTASAITWRLVKLFSFLVSIIQRIEFLQSRLPSLPGHIARKQLVKRSGSLLTGLVFAHWFLLPICPCERDALFSSTSKVQQQHDADLPSIFIVADSGHGEFCCGEQTGKNVHGSSPEVKPPKVMEAPAVDSSDYPNPGLLVNDVDGLRTSGNDPPPMEDLRLHLRWQVFLI